MFVPEPFFLLPTSPGIIYSACLSRDETGLTAIADVAYEIEIAVLTETLLDVLPVKWGLAAVESHTS